MEIPRNSLMKGGYYVGSWDIDGGAKQTLILKQEGTAEQPKGPFIKTPLSVSFCEDNCMSGTGIKFRHATMNEIQWLDNCIRAKKFVKRPQGEHVVNNFLLY